MKNLNKKIGVVVLSGLVIAGSGLASSASVFADFPEVKPSLERKSGFESGPLLIREVDKMNEEQRKRYNEDVKQLDLYKNILPEYWEYEVLYKGLKESEVSKLSKSYPNVKKVAKYFKNGDDFVSHMLYAGMPVGVYRVNIRGANFIIHFKK